MILMNNIILILLHTKFIESVMTFKKASKNYSCEY